MVSHKSFEQDLEVTVEKAGVIHRNLEKGCWMVAVKMEIHNYPRTAKEGMLENSLKMVEPKETHMLLKMHLMEKAENSVMHSHLMHHWTQKSSVMSHNSSISDLIQKAVEIRSCHFLVE